MLRSGCVGAAVAADDDDDDDLYSLKKLLCSRCNLPRKKKQLYKFSHL